VGRRVSIALRLEPDDHTIGTESYPAPSCLAIKNAIPDAPDGLYWVNRGDHESAQLYCDMTTEGGGWTRCAIMDYEAQSSLTAYAFDSEELILSDGVSSLGSGGTSAIKYSCFGLYSETGFGVTYALEGGIGDSYDFAYWWEIPPVDSSQNFAFIAADTDFSCDGLDNIPFTAISYTSSLQRWFMAGDGSSMYQCHIGSTYSGTSSGFWMQPDELTPEGDLWLELSDSMFDRLGTRSSDETIRRDGVLEYWVR